MKARNRENSGEFQTSRERQLAKENYELTLRLLEAQHKNLRDAKTGLWNEEGARAYAKISIENHKKSGEPLALLMLDIDNFKGLNSRFGEPEVDKIMKEFAEFLATKTRDTDVMALARTSGHGDEFVLLLDAKLKDVIGRLSNLEYPTTRNNEALTIKFSAGGADIDVNQEGDPFQTAYETASKRMHLAKEVKKASDK